MENTSYIARIMGYDGKDYRIGVDYGTDAPCACIILADEKGYTVVWTGTPEEVGEWLISSQVNKWNTNDPISTSILRFRRQY